MSNRAHNCTKTYHAKCTCPRKCTNRHQKRCPNLARKTDETQTTPPKKSPENAVWLRQILRHLFPKQLVLTRATSSAGTLCGCCVVAVRQRRVRRVGPADPASPSLLSGDTVCSSHPRSGVENPVRWRRHTGGGEGGERETLAVSRLRWGTRGPRAREAAGEDAQLAAVDADVLPGVTM